MHTVELQSGWRLRDESGPADDWIQVKNVPSVVHMELLREGRIPDPFESHNELDVEWVGERTWIYQTSFSVCKPEKNEATDLVFDGLDTYAQVQLNGETVLESDNMFLQYRVNVTDKLLAGQENILEIRFASALLRGRELGKEHAEHRFIAHNGEAGRLAVRKAQYHWGWDWGPVIMTAGPWRAVRLESYNVRIEDVHVTYELSKDRNSLSGTFMAHSQTKSAVVEFELSLGSDILVKAQAQVGENGTAKANFSLDKPRLWYPHGYGQQPLYSLHTRLLQGGSVMDNSHTRTSFRKVELVREPDAIGESFYFRINGVDVFCGGSCWIPGDNMLPRLTHEDYSSWLTTLKEGNQVMVRVWGGGIYEEDVFYDVCDELGVLVWQDFMFACGSYPTYDSFLENVKQEAQYNCRRLRVHPSIVVWAGANEDYQIQEEYHLDYQKSSDPKEWLSSSFPARYIYEHLLPIVVAEECPDVPYWPCSPFTGGGKASDDLTIGDVHQWNVWHGSQVKYQKFPDIGGRFNSEFGMCSLPVLSTVHTFTKDPKELYPQSRTLNFHNKAGGSERRISMYLIENFRLEVDLESWIYLTQLMQAETMRYAYRDWRRQWGASRRCGGALVWQLNDCWPCSSWAIVDYFLRKKPAFYTIQRELQPIKVGVRREHRDWSASHARPTVSLKYTVWISSSRLDAATVDIEVRHISVSTGKDLPSPLVKKDVRVGENGTSEVLEGVVHDWPKEPCAIAVRLLIDGVCVSRDVDWPEPFKYLDLSDRGMSLALSGETLTISAQKPVKGFVLDTGDEVSLSDNCIDVMPGDAQVIQLRGYKGSVEQLKWRILS